MTEAEFERVVREAVASIPEALLGRLENLDITITDWPSPADLDLADVPAGYTLYGLYTGVPLTDRTSAYNMVIPDQITIFRGPITEAHTDIDELRMEIRDTVIHELAHFFGLSDEDLVRIGVS